MATVDQTLDQILAAVRQLPEPMRKKLLQEIEALPKAEQARAAARQLRGQHRMQPQQRKRMSALLAKGNAGTLTAEERTELTQLVAEFETKTLALAQAITEAVDLSSSQPAPSRTITE